MHLTLNVHDKNTQHSRNIRKLPQSDKRTLQKPIANITLNGESLNVFSYIKNSIRKSYESEKSQRTPNGPVELE